MDRDEIEAQIRQILDSETKAIPLSNKLFRPDGLFAKLAKTASERRELTKTPLFQAAQRRLSELQRQEMAEFRKVVDQVGEQLPNGMVSCRPGQIATS